MAANSRAVQVRCNDLFLMLLSFAIALLLVILSSFFGGAVAHCL